MKKRNLQDTLDIEKKLRGYLFGSACGDALGLPVEHLNLEEIKKNTGKGDSRASPRVSLDR